jgi:hypothetical protein
MLNKKVNLNIEQCFLEAQRIVGDWITSTQRVSTVQGSGGPAFTVTVYAL